VGAPRQLMLEQRANSPARCVVDDDPYLRPSGGHGEPDGRGPGERIRLHDERGDRRLFRLRVLFIRICRKDLSGPIDVKAKIRYRHPETEARVLPIGESRIEIRLSDTGSENTLFEGRGAHGCLEVQGDLDAILVD